MGRGAYRRLQGWVWAALGGFALLILMAPPALAVQSLPSFEQVRAAHVSSEARIVDRHGQPLSEIRLDPNGRRLEWVGLRELSPAMLEALLAAEDRRFYEHGGVDWRAVAAALWQNLWYDRTRGASTLSMQLAGLLDPALRASATHGGRRTLGQKWDQALAANALEAHWSKEQILEAYLNLAPFRGDLEGVPAAAWGLFRKTPATLARAEAAVLAVLLRGPNAAPGLVAQRACLLVRRLADPQACRATEALAAGLAKARFEPRWNLAPELARRLLRQPGEVFPTTLDREAQLAALAAVAQKEDGAAVVVLDNASAGVLALVGPAGGDGPRAGAGLLQPLVYGLALERRVVTAATLLPIAEGADGWVSTRSALAAGLPGPAEYLAQHLGPPGMEDRLRGLDLPGGPAGPFDLLTLAGLYRSVAAGGQWLAPYLTAGDPRPPRRILRPEAAFLTAEMLAEPGAPRALVGAAEGDQAVALGFDAGITVAVRLTGSTEVARGVAQALLAGVTHGAVWLKPPAGVVQQWVVFEPPVEPARREWFLRGTEISLSAPPPVPVRILWPANESVVDVREELADPDFQVTFEARPGAADLRWRLNGTDLATGPQAHWRPVGGLVHLELLNAEGVVLDQVSFAVRAP